MEMPPTHLAVEQDRLEELRDLLTAGADIHEEYNGFTLLHRAVRDVVLDPVDIAQLRQPLLTIEPDDSYGDHAAAMEPVGMATLWDSPDGLCIRYGPSYTRYLTDEKAFVRAHERLGDAFEEHGSIVSLSPGDLLIIDNNVMVHGRVSFRPPLRRDPTAG